MRNPLSGHRLRAALWAGTVFSVLPSLALAQNQAVITGRVTSSRGDPIAGATVLVNSTNHGASTNANGVYTITIQCTDSSGNNGKATTTVSVPK